MQKIPLIITSLWTLLEGFLGGFKSSNSPSIPKSDIDEVIQEKLLDKQQEDQYNSVNIEEDLIDEIPEIKITYDYLNDPLYKHVSVLKTSAQIAQESKLEERFQPFLDKNYLGFKEALGFKESGGRYHIVNKFGYLGKYQFSLSTLEVLGLKSSATRNNFLKSSSLQESAFYAHTARNKWILKRDIARFKGKYMNGIKVTESGILAAAHLVGAGAVKIYLRSYGREHFSDAFGTTIRHYMRRFSGYDLSFVKPKRLPRLKDPHLKRKKKKRR